MTTLYIPPSRTLQKRLLVVLIPLFLILAIAPTKQRNYVRINNRRKLQQQYDNNEGPVVELLQRAGINVSRKNMAKLPTSFEVTQLYGPRPIIAGLEMCYDFRQKNLGRDVILTAGGLFNTGTNFLYGLLQKNCKIGEVRNDIWWKHSPAEWAHNSEYSAYRSSNSNNMAYRVHPRKNSEYIMVNGTHRVKYEKYYDNVLSVVSIKDPFFWMSSMCSRPHTAKWGFTSRMCPNLVPSKNLAFRHNLTSDVDVYARLPKTFHHDDIPSLHLHYKSLVDYWNRFNMGHYRADFPHLMIRYEDLLFHPEAVVRDVCECAGGVMNDNFFYVTRPKGPTAPGEKRTTGLVEAIIKYGDRHVRQNGFTEADKEYANEWLNSELMEKFHYTRL